MKISKKTLLVAGMSCLITAATGTVMGVCPGGEEENAPDSLEMAHAVKWADKGMNCLKDMTLDNPEDSTTGRYKCIKNLFLGALSPEEKTVCRKILYPVFVDLAKNDPYPKVRVTALEYTRLQGIPKRDWYTILTAALDDPHWYVKTYAACLIVRNCLYDSIAPDPRALVMVKNTALGMDRPKWHVKGFYAVKQSENKTEAVENAKDLIQSFATSCLDVYIHAITDNNRNVLEYLDSLENHGTTEDLRSAARYSKKIYNKKLILR